MGPNFCCALARVLLPATALHLFRVTRPQREDKDNMANVARLARYRRHPHYLDGRICGLVPRIGRVPERARVFLL